MKTQNQTGFTQMAQAKKPTFSMAITAPNTQQMISRALKNDKMAARFTSTLIGAVSASEALKACDPGTIIAAGLRGEGMGLIYGHGYYIVPYGSVATYLMSYKGYIQLAMSTGYYADIDCVEVREGELEGRSRRTGKPVINLAKYDTDEERESHKVIGYYAYFELNNGFRKVLYWSKDKMLAHADRYSQAFHLEAREAQDPRYSRVSYADFVAGNYPKGDEWKYSSFWYKDFDGMACKTMLRQLISKWGIMSIDLQKALASDEAAIGTDGSKNYLDAPENAPEALPEANPETGEVIEPSSNTAPELPDGIFEDATGQQALA